MSTGALHRLAPKAIAHPIMRSLLLSAKLEIHLRGCFGSPGRE